MAAVVAVVAVVALVELVLVVVLLLFAARCLEGAKGVPRNGGRE